MLPSFVLAQQWGWRALLRGRTSPRLPLGCSSRDAAATGKAKHPHKLGTAWRELVAAKPSRKAWQERDWQAQGDVSFPICLALAPQGFAPLGRVHVGQGLSSGRAVALTPALNRVPFSGGFTLWVRALQGLQLCCREFLKRGREEWPVEMAEIIRPFGARRAPSWQRQPWKTSTNLEV